MRVTGSWIVRISASEAFLDARKNALLEILPHACVLTSIVASVNLHVVFAGELATAQITLNFRTLLLFAIVSN